MRVNVEASTLVAITSVFTKLSFDHSRRTVVRPVCVHVNVTGVPRHTAVPGAGPVNVAPETVILMLPVTFQSSRLDSSKSRLTALPAPLNA